MIQFAANYSTDLATLINTGLVNVDRVKCPAWPDTVNEALKVRPVWVHFPLNVGSGMGTPRNSETKAPVVWAPFEQLMDLTGTHLMNVHLGPVPSDAPDIPYDSLKDEHIRRISDALIRDVESVTNHFGAENVIAENIFCAQGFHHQAATLPSVITEVIETTGCYLLLDVSHARQAARELGMEAEDYLAQLPVHRIKELHITGIQRLEGKWETRLRALGDEAKGYEAFYGELIDHLPMTDEDWSFFAWMLEQVRFGHWAKPHIISFEYGGVGPVFEAMTERDTLLEQIPRLYNETHSTRVMK